MVARQDRSNYKTVRAASGEMQCNSPAHSCSSEPYGNDERSRGCVLLILAIPQGNQSLRKNGDSIPMLSDRKVLSDLRGKKIIARQSKAAWLGDKSQALSYGTLGTRQGCVFLRVTSPTLASVSLPTE